MTVGDKPIVAQSWADAAITSLAGGFSHVVRPRGHSMSPRIKDGAEVYLQPCNPADVKKGDVVLVRVRGRNLLHLVKARDGDRLLIGNNKGGTNGWVNQSAVYGVATGS